MERELAAGLAGYPLQPSRKLDVPEEEACLRQGLLCPTPRLGGLEAVQEAPGAEVEADEEMAAVLPSAVMADLGGMNNSNHGFVHTRRDLMTAGCVHVENGGVSRRKYCFVHDCRDISGDHCKTAILLRGI